MIFIKVTELQESKNLCNHSVVGWHEIAKTFAMIDYFREMTAEHFSHYGEYGSFENLLYFSLFLCLLCSCSVGWFCFALVNKEQMCVCICGEGEGGGKGGEG